MKRKKRQHTSSGTGGPIFWGLFALIAIVPLALLWVGSKSDHGERGETASENVVGHQEVTVTSPLSEPAPLEDLNLHDSNPGQGAREGSNPELLRQETSSSLDTLANRTYLDYLNEGNEKLALGELESALALYLQAQEMEKEDEDVFFNLGVVMARLGKLDESMVYYQKALEIFPDYAEAHNNLGNIHLKQGSLDEAEEAFKRALEVYPEYALAENNLGNVLGRKGDPVAAAEHFSRAVELDPSYVEARYNLGNAYALQRQFERARGEFNAIIEMEPDFVHALKALEALDKVQAVPGVQKP